jgi:hypothetical protein
LQKEIRKLQIEKDNLEKENKEFSNHRCDTLNNAELNRVKDKLSQAIQERDKLKEKLNSRGPDIPENEDIENLNAEELKQIIHQKEKEIYKLKSEVERNNIQNNSNNTNYGL